MNNGIFCHLILKIIIAAGNSDGFFAKMFSFFKGQCHGLPPPPHSYDNREYTKSNFPFEYLREIEAIFKNVFTCQTEAKID